MARFASKSNKTINKSKVITRTSEQPDAMAQRPDATVNHEGGLAFKTGPEMDLYLRCCASFLQDSFYRSENQELTELRKAIAKCDRKFVLQLANYSRNAMNLRTIPQVMLAEASRLHSGDPSQPKSDVREYTPKILQRADEPLEVIAYLLGVLSSKRKLSNALKKGITDAIRNYVKVDPKTGEVNLYQLSKYWRGTSRKKGAVTPKDLLRICHLGKKADPIMKEVAQMVFNDSLPVAETWEVEASTKGTSTEMWNDMAPKMGIMALLRNLRNFEQHSAENAIEHAVSVFTNPEAVAKSRLLPFRWFTAMKHVSDTRLRDAICEAMDLSIENVPKLPGITAVFADNSGSMHSQISAKSQVQCIEVASMMAAIGTHLTTGKSVVGAFGTTCKEVPLSRRDSILTNADKIRKADVGWCTNAYLIVQHLLNKGTKVNRLMLFSDMQCYSTTNSNSYYGSDQQLGPLWRKYVQTINPNAVLYSVDLHGYGTSQFPEDDPNVVLLAGWSEKVFDLICSYEDRASAINMIKRDW